MTQAPGLAAPGTPDMTLEPELAAPGSPDVTLAPVPPARRPGRAENARGFGRVVLRVSILTFLAQGCGFASSIAIAHVLGASHATDAYFLGLSVPLLVYGAFVAAARLGAIPALTDEAARGESAFTRASSELASATLVVALLLSVVAAAIALTVLPLTIGNASLIAPTRVKVLELAPLGVLGAMMGSLGAILAVRNRFAAAAIVLAFDPILRIVLLVVLGSVLGTNALVVASLAGNTLAVLLMWMLVRRDGVPLRLGWFPQSRVVRRILLVSAPLLVCQVVVQMNPVVDRAMAGTLRAGSITALELGLRVFAVPMTLIGATLIGPLAATWSARRAAGGWPVLRDSVNRAITAFVMVLPPLLVLGIALRHQLVSLMYQGGAYSGHATDETASVFAMLLVGLPAQLVTIAFATLFVVEEQTKFVLKTGVVNVVLNVGLNFALRPALGVSGIALSTSVTYTLVLAIYVGAARKRWDGVVIPFWGPAGLRSVIAVGLMASAAYALTSSFSAVAGRVQLAAEVTLVALAVLAIYGGVLLTNAQKRKFVGERLRSFTPKGLLAPQSDRSEKR